MFLYYLPGKEVATIDRDAVRAAGLGDVLRDLLVSASAFREGVSLAQVHARGPGERRSGVIVAPLPCAAPPRRIGYYPEAQTWRDCGGYWIGWETAALPGPAELARPAPIDGYELLLGDGHVWVAPTLRRGVACGNLPRAMGLDEAGQFTLRVLPAFGWAWDLGGEIFDTVFGAPSIAWEKAFDLAVRALSINYRMGPIEASILGLVTTENFQRLFDAAVDFDLVRELLALDEEGSVKKKMDSASAAGPAPFSPGPADGTPPTPPAAAIST